MHRVPAVAQAWMGPRAAEMEQLRQALASYPQVGVTGPGGIGKTTLCALFAQQNQTREQFPDGIFWIASEPVCSMDMHR